MKKVSLVILDKDVRKALPRLREAGVMHLEALPGGSGETLESLDGQISRVDSALSRLDTSIKPDPAGEIFDIAAAENAVADLLKIDEDRKNLLVRHAQIVANIERLVPFGDFEPAEIAILRSKGINIRLYDASMELADQLEAAGVPFFVLKRVKKQLLIAAVFLGPVPEEFEPGAMVLPEFGITELTQLLNELERDIAANREQIVAHSKNRAVFERLREILHQRRELEALSTGIDGEGLLTWITGFVPENRIDSVNGLAASQGWGVLVRDPDPDDPTPTLIHNGPRVRIIEPVFKFLGTLPGYRELDISLYFLTYFSIFFAMIIGDGGYGVLFLIASVVLIAKSGRGGRKVPDALKLLLVLSVATVAWGTITGNWFGSRAIASLPILRILTVPGIATYPDLFPGVDADPQKAVMWLCFLLGLSQLTLANLLNFIRDFPKPRAFSHMGWGAIIGGLYFLVLNLVIGSSMPPFATYLIAGGFSLVIVFGAQSPGTGFIKGILKGVGGAFTTFLNAISGFSNIISYIRLFAVGMSSFYIASSFNDLAGSMLSGWTIPFGIIIIAIGHGLNLIMAVLSVVVHGIRLNMLEFSGQLGMEWTGIEFNPFRVRISEENTNQGVPS